jgi:sporulation protein YhbH
MIMKIEKDHSRFRQIVKGKIRKELRKYISRGEMIGRKGNDVISIPVSQIRLPHFRYGSKGVGGVGQGDGEPGTPLSPVDGDGTGQAGEDPGQHILEVDVTLEELAQLLGEELELPNIEPRGKKNIVEEKGRYTGVRNAGPESLKHFRRTFKTALKRQIISGTYNPDDPVIVPVREDKRYRSWKVTENPESNAVIIHMMDVSGSMGDEQKEIVRIEAFWIDTWLRSQYQNVETCYIVHDAAAYVVDRETFYHLRESGGTKISTAYQLCNRLIDEKFPPSDWNIYPFHFSDGDNWGGGDTEECLTVLEEALLPKVNLMCYGQVESAYGSGQFIKSLNARFGDDERLVTSEIADKDKVYDSIKEFLGKGR